MMWERSATSQRGGVSPLNMLDWKERSRTFDAVGGFVPGVGGMVMGGAGRQRGNGFPTMGHRGDLRRARRQADCRPDVPSSDDEADAPRVVVLSEAFWRTRFDADPR